MIDIDYSTNANLYEDYEECLTFLNKIDEKEHEYPDEITPFHVYTEIKTRKELMVVKSYLATQNLEKTKLIIWSDYDITDNPLIQPYKDYVTLKIYNPEEQASGTFIEGSPKLKMKDPKYYLQSDLARILLLHKYGGVWADMDIIFLRDFKPILDQEYMYMWGSETNFILEGACASVLSGKKESQFMTNLLRQLMQSPALPGTTCWGKDMFATLYRKYKFNILPASFFNIEWCMGVKHRNITDEIQKQWFLNPLQNQKYLFLESFGWHWHNSSKKDFEIVPGSKFDLLEKLTEKKLKEKGIL